MRRGHNATIMDQVTWIINVERLKYIFKPPLSICMYIAAYIITL